MDYENIIYEQDTEFIENNVIPDTEEAQMLLTEAIQKEDYFMVKFLIEYDVRVNHEQVTTAILSQDIKILKYVLKHSDYLDEVNIADAIFDSESYRELRYTIKRYNELLASDEPKPTPVDAVDQAIEFDNKNALMVLVGKISLTKSVGNSIATYAIVNEHEDLLKKLLDMYPSYKLDGVNSQEVLLRKIDWIYKYKKSLTKTTEVEELLKRYKDKKK